MKKLIHLIKPPCAKCAYTLGLIQFVENPCPSCKLNSYSTYDIFVNGKYKQDEIKMKDTHRR